MKVPPVQIQLKFLDRAIASVRSDDLRHPIAIGRDESSAWRAPEGDRTMAQHAAVLQMKGGEPQLKAERDASFRVNGVEMRDRILKSGDRVSLGDCEIWVSTVREHHFYAPWHRLEEIGGNRKGGFVDLKGETFTVGSAEDAGLRLKDDTVSHRHATLALRGDECWVHDETSRNGTRVNGQRLGGKDRLLRDGDILSFGPFDYRFLDRSVRHVRTNSAMGAFSILLTLLIVAGAWYAVYKRMPDVSDYVVAAGQLAAAERFDEADEMMQKARKARGFAAVEAAWRIRKDRLAEWRATSDAWNEFKSVLASGRLSLACTQIGLLSLDQRVAWDWNDKTLDARLDEAREAAALVQLATDLWCARNEVDLTDEALKALSDRRARFGVDRDGYADDERPWMRSLRQQVVSRAKLLDENEARYASLTNELAKVAVGALDPAKITNDLAKTVFETSGRVRLFAHRLREPLAKIQGDYQNILADARALAALDSAAYAGRPVATTPDDCSVSPYLGDSQRWCVEQRRKLDLAALGLRAIRDRLLKFGTNGISPEPPSLLALEDTNRVERAFKCELLKAPRPPNPSRTAPVDDEYDRLFGYEFLYTYMIEGYYAFPKDIDMTKAFDMTFEPEIRKLYFLFEEIEMDLKVLKGAEFEDLHTGALAELESRLASWRARIQAVAKRFDAIADDPQTQNTRRGIIARGVGIYLLPTSSVEQVDWEDFRKRALWYKDIVFKRLDDLNPTRPAEARAAAKWIMANGLPGSPSVRKAWSYLK